MNAQKYKYGAVILAAGKGTRMHSPLPKVLHEILGENMLGLVADAVRPLCGENIWSVIGHEADLVKACLGERAGNYVLQKEQLGTGHALSVAWDALKKSGLKHILVINGDTPLISTKALNEFASMALNQKDDLAFMTLTMDNPGSFGRVLRENSKVKAIIEAKDYDSAKHGDEPKEINAGIYFINISKVEPLLKKISNNNKSGEYYITDLITLGVAAGLQVNGINQAKSPEHISTFLGINSPAELVQAEEILRSNIVHKLIDSGVLLRSPDSVRISPKAVIEPGAEIYGPCEIYGNSYIASGASIDSNCWIKNTRIASQAKIRSFCHFETASIAEYCTVGPFARLRPGAKLETKAHVGNFVEMKKSTLGEGAKAGHLSYLGDATIGAGSNIGAGTITCNYDGKNKHATIIEDNAFIGSNTALVAPVTIGKDALVGAGSVITKNVPPESLAVARGKQIILPQLPKSNKKSS